MPNKSIEQLRQEIIKQYGTGAITLSEMEAKLDPIDRPIRPAPDRAYYIRFDFTAGEKPPTVLICNDRDEAVVEVYEAPTTPLGQLVESKLIPGLYSWVGNFSWDEDDWQPGTLAAALLDFMNDDANPAKL